MNTIYKLFILLKLPIELNYLRIKINTSYVDRFFIYIIVVGLPCYFISRFLITNYRNKIKLFKKDNKI